MIKRYLIVVWHGIATRAVPNTMKTIICATVTFSLSSQQVAYLWLKIWKIYRLCLAFKCLHSYWSDVIFHAILIWRQYVVDTLFSFTYVHSFFPFIVSLAESLSISTASVIFRPVASPKHLFNIFIDTGKCSPLWNSCECRCNGLLVSWLSQSSKCWSVLSLMLLPVRPRYFRLQLSHCIS